MRGKALLAAVVIPGALLIASSAAAQTPLPFPKPGQPSKPAPKTPPSGDPGAAQPQPAASQPQTAGTPSEETLGMPVYPTSTFIASYDAGRGQRYYLFGTNASFIEIVAYYRSILRERGDQVYEEPPVHMFEVGRFREQTMAFPPSITVKDYTWGGSQGYLVPTPGSQGVRYKTIIQIVPPPAGASGG